MNQIDCLRFDLVETYECASYRETMYYVRIVKCFFSPIGITQHLRHPPADTTIDCR